MKQLNNLALQVNNGSIKIEEAIVELRGGDIFLYLALVIGFIFLFRLNDCSFGVEGFEPIPLPHKDPFGWSSGKYYRRGNNPYGSKQITGLKMEKPTSMPQQDYSSLTKSERRKLPDPLGRDRSINVDGYTKLEIRFNQVEYKTGKHGKDHGLPLGNNFKTPKTEANVLALRDSLVDMPNRKNIVWYTDGQYQGGIDRGCYCVHLFDKSTDIIAVYEKQPDGSNLFLTTFKLNDNEVNHLEVTNGNFLSEKMLRQRNWDGLYKTRREPMVITPINQPNLLSNDMDITPIDNSQSIINNSQSNNP